MPIIKDVFRALPGGDAIASKVATVKKLVDLSTVSPSSGDMTSGSDGVFSGTFGYLGPYKYTISDGDTTKEHSSLSQGQVGSWWPAEAPFIFAALGDGTVDDAALKVTASGSDMTVSVAAGAALVDGHPYVWDTAQSLTIPAADATNPRIDRIILRLYAPGHTEQGRIDLLVLQGTAAATPSAPGLEQDLVTDKLYEISLAQVYVDAAATSIAADKVTDERGRLTLPPPDGSVTLAKLAPAGTAGQVLTSTGGSTPPAYQNLPPTTPPDGSVTTAKLADGAVTLVKLAANSVDASKLVDGSVGNAELAANAVTNSKILDGTITTAELADAIITTAKLQDNSVTAAKLADGALQAYPNGASGNANGLSGTSSFVDSATFSWTLPQGTYTIKNAAFLTVAGDSGSDDGQMRAVIGGFANPVVATTAMGLDNTPLFNYYVRTGVALDGSTALTFKIQHRNNGNGTCHAWGWMMDLYALRTGD